MPTEKDLRAKHLPRANDERLLPAHFCALIISILRVGYSFYAVYDVCVLGQYRRHKATCVSWRVQEIRVVLRVKGRQRR